MPKRKHLQPLRDRFAAVVRACRRCSKLFAFSKRRGKQPLSCPPCQEAARDETAQRQNAARRLAKE